MKSIQILICLLVLVLSISAEENNNYEMYLSEHTQHHQQDRTQLFLSDYGQDFKDVSKFKSCSKNENCQEGEGCYQVNKCQQGDNNLACRRFCVNNDLYNSW